MSPEDPRFTAYLLGELRDAAEVSEVERALAAEPALRAELEAMRGLALNLRGALREPEVEPAPVRAPARVLAFRPAAEESAPWRRQLLRIAAVFLLSAGAIGFTGWYTSQKETKAVIPDERLLTALEVDLDPADGGADVLPQEQAAAARTALQARWARLAAGLRAGQLPAAEAIPAQTELLSLLPVAGGRGIAVSAAGVPGKPNQAWLSVVIPAHLVTGRTVGVDTRRVDEVSVRETASGFGPGGERVLLFTLTTSSEAPVVTVHVPGLKAVAIPVESLRSDFRRAPEGLRQAVALAVFAEALRSPAGQAKAAIRRSLAIVEAAGEAVAAVQLLNRQAAELIERQAGA